MASCGEVGRKKRRGEGRTSSCATLNHQRGTAAQLSNRTLQPCIRPIALATSAPLAPAPTTRKPQQRLCLRKSTCRSSHQKGAAVPNSDQALRPCIRIFTLAESNLPAGAVVQSLIGTQSPDSGKNGVKMMREIQDSSKS